MSTLSGGAKLFTRATRVRRQADFNYIRRAGSNRGGRYIAVRAARPREPGWRVAIVVSRRFSRLAVVRNRAKRVLREACRQVLPEFNQCWLVIRPRQPIKQAGTPAVAEELRRTLQSLKCAKQREQPGG